MSIAGPLANGFLSYDVFDFNDPSAKAFVEAYRAKWSGVINAQLFSRMYSTPVELVRVYEYDPAFAIKITIPRPVVSGAIGDSDVHGGQQFGPLVELEIPLP